VVGVEAVDGPFAHISDSHRFEKALRAKPIYEARGLSLRLGVSCGVAGYPWSGEDIAHIVQCADADMYRVKAARKGRAQTDPVPL